MEIEEAIRILSGIEKQNSRTPEDKQALQLAIEILEGTGESEWHYNWGAYCAKCLYYDGRWLKDDKPKICPECKRYMWNWEKNNTLPNKYSGRRYG